MKQKINFKDENILKYFTTDVTRCARLHTLLLVVACCWELLRKVWNQSNFQLRANEHNNSQQCCVCLHGGLAYYRVKVYVIGIA